MFKRRSAQNTESKMGGFLKKQLLDIIEWEDDSQDTLVYKFPMQDNEIQNGGRLVVRESQVGIFMDKGVIEKGCKNKDTREWNFKNGFMPAMRSSSIY